MTIKKIIALFSIILCSQSIGKTLSVKKYREQLKSEQETEKNISSNVVTLPTKTSIERKKENFISSDKRIRKKIMEIAFSKLNFPYFYGASGEQRFDCSSFIQYVFKKSVNVSLPRVSYEQAAYGTKIDYKNLKEGDIVAFDTLNKNRITHVGLYIGKNRFIHASSGYKKVVVSELKGFYAEKFRYGVKIIWQNQAIKK